MKKKGSMTVEAAVLVPVAVIIILSLIWFMLFVFDHMVMKHAAGRLAVQMLEERLNGEDHGADSEEARERLEGLVMISEDIRIETEITDTGLGTGAECTVRITAGIRSPLRIFGALLGRSHSVSGRAAGTDIKEYRYLVDNGKELLGADNGE